MLSESFIDVVESDLSKITRDLSEVALDQVFNEDLWKDIPVINSLVSLFKIGFNIKDRIFFKKLLLFFGALQTIPFEKRVHFIGKFSSEKKNELGEKLILVIEQLDDIEKPIIIANLFKAYIYEKFDNQMFFRLSSVVQRSYINDLHFLKNNHNKSMSGYESLGLYNNSLVFISNFNEVEPLKTEYKVNSVGENLVQYGFNWDA